MRRSSSLRIGLTLAAVASATATASPAQAAAGLVWIEGSEVWASTVDGSTKLRLSGGEGDWREVGQSDSGYIVGTRRPSGKISDLTTFTVWDPSGKEIRSGPLTGLRNGGQNLQPLGLELTQNAGLVVYGFWNTIVTTYPQPWINTRGFILLPSATVVSPALSPLNVTTVRAPALFGDRVIGTDGSKVYLQDPSTIASESFTEWPGLSVSGAELNDLDVAATGRTLALGLDLGSGAPAGRRSRIIVQPVPGLGIAPTAIVPGDSGDCWVPQTGEAYDASLSLDGTRLAWRDAAGVHVAGTPVVQPTTPPENLCTFSSPAVTIAPAGSSSPSFGGLDVAAIAAARAGTAGGTVPGAGGGGGAGAGGAGGGAAGGAGAGGGAAGGAGAGGSTPGTKPGTTPNSPGATPPKVVVPAKVLASSLGTKRGAAVKVFSGVSGTASLTLTVLPKAIGRKGKTPIVIARGSAKFPGDDPQAARTVQLTATKTGRAALRRLRGKTVTLTVVLAGQTTQVSFKLR